MSQTPAPDEFGRTPANAPEPAAYGVNRARHCTVCGYWVAPLAIFPRDRCQPCHAAAPEVRRQIANLTARDLARMWGATA